MKPKIILYLALVLSGNCYAAIVYPKASDGGQLVISNYVSQVQFNDFDTLHGLKMEDLTITNPFLIYDVRLTNLAQGQLLAATEARWWQYLLLHGTNSVGSATLRETNGKLRIVGYFETYFSTETLEALRIAEQLPQIKKQNYELRRLDIAPILFQAVWLHGKSDDIIMPLPNTFGRWNAYQPYPEKQILKLLKQEAKKN